MLPKIKAFFSFVIFACIIVGLINHAEASTITAGHPRLFITSDNLPTLQQRAATTHSNTYGALKTWCENNWNNLSVQKSFFSDTGCGSCVYDSGPLRYALIYALGPITGFNYSQYSINDFGDKAVSIMMDIVNNGGYQLNDVVPIMYDWVNARMSSGQKTTVVNWIQGIIGNNPQISTSYYGYRFLTPGHSSDEPNPIVSGLAFYGDGINDSLATTYTDFAVNTWLPNLKALGHVANDDGGHATGPSYTQYAFVGNVYGYACQKQCGL